LQEKEYEREGLKAKSRPNTVGNLSRLKNADDLLLIKHHQDKLTPIKKF